MRAWAIGVLLLSTVAAAQDEKPRLIAQLGHSDYYVTEAVFSPDARYVLTGGADGQAILWETATGREVRRFGGLAGPVHSLNFTQDGRQILAGHENSNACVLWSVGSGSFLRQFQLDDTGHTFALSPNGRFIATSGSARVIELAKGKRPIDQLKANTVFELGDQNVWWNDVRYSPDGRWIVTVGEGAAVWDAATGKLIHRLAADFVSHYCRQASFTADGARLATFVEDQGAILWNVVTGQEIRRFAHAGICSVALSPDGRLLATGDDGRGENEAIVRVWDVATGKELWHGDASWHVYTLDFAPDGHRLVAGTGSNPPVAILWDTATGKEVRRFGTASSRVHRASFVGRSRLVTATTSLSRDGGVYVWDGRAGGVVRSYQDREKAPVTLSRDGRQIRETVGQSVRVHDVATGSVLRAEERAKSNTERIVARLRPEPELLRLYSNPGLVSPDGRHLVFGSSPSFVFDLETGREAGRVKTDAEPSAFSQDGKFFYTRSMSDDKGIVTKWDVASSKQVAALPVRANWIGPGLVATKDSAGTSVVVRRIATGEEVARLAHDAVVDALAFSKDDQVVVTGTRDGGAMVWDLRSGKILHRLSGHTNDVRLVAISPDKRFVFTGDRDADLRLWDAGTGQQLRRLRGLREQPRAVSFSPDGSRVAASDDAGFVRVWNTESGREAYRLARQPGNVRTLAFLPDGGLFALTSVGIGRLWDPKGTLVRTFRFTSGSRTTIRDVVVSPDERLVLTGSWNASPVLWDAATGKEIRRFDGHSAATSHVAFAPDGKTAASGSEDGTVIVWEVATGRRLRQFPASTGWVFSIAFSSDGTAIAAGGAKGETRVWDVKTGRRLRDFRGHGGEVMSVEFSHNDELLLSSAADGTARLWSMSRNVELCRLINFNDGSWVVFDSEGRFDASDAGAVQGLYWVVGIESISLDQLKERYYEPGLLGKALGLDPKPRRSVRGFTAPKLFPHVRVEPPAGDRANLKIRLANRGGGIGRVVVRINGKEMLADARGGGADPQAEKLSLAIPLAGDPRIKPGADNEIEVLAYNAEGYLRSRGMRVTYKAPGQVSDALPELWAIVAGSADYAGDALDLRYAAKDAADFSAALETAAEGLFGAKRVHLAHVKRPTRAKLTNVLDAAREAKPHDILVVYLAGHGVSFGGQDGDFYYLTSEAASADLSDPAVRAAVALSSVELTELVKSIPALKQVLILDTCASGKFIEKLTERRNVPTSQLRALERLKERTGLHILAGCAADRVSYEASRYAQGLLTYSLLLGMRGAALKDDEYVDVSRLFQFAADRVPELAGEIGGIQRPVIASPKGGTSFDIGKLDETTKANVPLRSVRPLVLRSNFQDDAELEDVLGLGKQVNALLRTAKGPVYVDAIEFPDAYRVVGRYSKEGETVTVDVRLSKGKKKIARFEVKGHGTELAKTIVAEAVRRMR